MNYNILTNTEGDNGYYNYPIGAETFFVLYSSKGLELINSNDYTERYEFSVQGNIDGINEVELPKDIGDAPTKCIMMSLHKLGLQSVRFEYVGTEVQATFSNITYVDLECRDFVQLGDYIVACNQETYKDANFQDIPSSALSVIRMSNECDDEILGPCTLNYTGIYDENTLYSRGDIVEYPKKSLSRDNTETISYERKLTCADGLGKDLIWTLPTGTGKLIDVTDELFDTHAICTYNDGTDHIITDAGQLGILFYSFDSNTGVLTLDDYFREDTDELAENYNFFIFKDNDYIYFNRNNNLIKLNITDFTDYTKFDFGEEVNAINIHNDLGRVITSSKVYDVNFSLFNPTDIDLETKLKVDGADISNDNAFKIEGNSVLDYSYLYIKNDNTYLKIIRDGITIELFICSGKAKDFSVLNNLYYIIDNSNTLSIYDWVTKSFISEENTYYNNIDKNLLYQGVYVQSIDSVNSIFSIDDIWDMNTSIKSFIVTDEDNIDKLKNKDNDIVQLEITEYEYKITHHENNLLIMYNNNTKILLLKNLLSNKTKEFRGVELFDFKDETLYILTPKILYSALINTVEPKVECIVLDEKSTPKLPINDNFKCTKIDILSSGDDYAESVSEEHCHETILDIKKLPKDKFIFRYNVQSINIGIFDSSNNELQYMFEGDEKIQDIQINDKYVFFIGNETIKVFDLDLVLVTTINLAPSVVITYPKGFINNDILVLASGSNIVYIDTTDINNVVILDTVNQEYINGSEINILSDRLFMCTQTGIKEFVFDITNIDYTNVINTYALQSSGLNSRLENDSTDNKAFDLELCGNDLYFVSLPSADVLYAPSNGKLNNYYEEYYFGYNNIMVDNHYRLEDNIGNYHTDLIKINVVDVIKTEEIKDYRVLDVCHNDNDSFYRTDEEVIHNNSALGIEIPYVGKVELFGANNTYLVTYSNNQLKIFNLIMASSLIVNIDDVKYLQVDKSNDRVYCQTNSQGYYVSLFSGIITPVPNKSVQSSFFNTELVSIEGPKKDMQEGDRLLSIFSKELDTFNSIDGVTAYTIDEGLQNLTVYVDKKKTTDFTYIAGVLDINYPFTGYEIISYSYLEEPFYGSDNINYEYRYNETATPKGTDKYGNDIFDWDELSTAQKPTDIKNVGTLKQFEVINSINGITAYTIDEGLQNLTVYVDKKKTTDFTYIAGVLDINYPFTGYEIISYSYLLEI